MPTRQANNIPTKRKEREEEPAIKHMDVKGMGKSPMFGDYEAQRHWMELTLSLPPTQWYQNNSRNDLNYWGLDYPPLTAYHSLLIAHVSHSIHPPWTRLGESRGTESPEHKLFMRASVILSDILIFFPAVIAFVFLCQKPKGSLQEKCYLLALHLLYPGWLLIDHGHFQYNCVSLGLALLAAVSTLRHLVIGTTNLNRTKFDYAALSFKQMELYHALPFFVALFRYSFRPPSLPAKLGRLSWIGVCTIATFALIWAPFLTSLEDISQVLHRVFPVARGIFEDKVANVWCSLSVVFKWNQLFTTQEMLRISLGATLVAVSPGFLLSLFGKGGNKSFRLHLLTSALSFFLFSFQVHEKSILLAALPALMLLLEEPLVVIWFLLVSVISMHPLFVKDGTTLAFYALQIAYSGISLDFLKSRGCWSRGMGVVMGLSLGTGMALCILSELLTPPAHWPHLGALVLSVYGCAHFVLVCFWATLHHFLVAFPPKSKTD